MEIKVLGKSYSILDHKRLMTEDPEYKKNYTEEREKELIEYWGNLKPFDDTSFIPEFPNSKNPYFIERVIELGGIPKKDLEDGTWYYGSTRNARLCKWDLTKQEMGHYRWKFGYCWDTVNHFEDDNGFSLFIPIRKATIEEIREMEKIESGLKE